MVAVTPLDTQLTLSQSTAGGPPSLGNQVGRSFGWAFLNMFVSRIAIFLTGIALARLLSPKQFGVYAVALTAMSLLMTLNDVGVIPTIIRWQGDTNDIVSTGRTLSLASSVALYAITFAGAPFFASALGAPEATGVLRVLALTIIIDGIVAIPLGLLSREFRQDRQLFAELPGLAVYIAGALLLAANGFGPWSIVVGRLGGAAVTGLLMVLLAPHHRGGFGFERTIAGEMMRFGMPLAVSIFIQELILNIDYIVVGTMLGTTSLGLYLLAFNLSSLPVNLVARAVDRVAFAGFSRLIHDKRKAAEALIGATGLLVTLLVPFVTIIAILSQQIVQFVYSSKWLPAAVPLRYLVFLGGARVIFEVCIDFVVAHGNSKWALWLRLVWFVALIPALMLGAHTDNIRGVGIAHITVAGFVIFPLILVMLNRQGISVARFLSTFIRPLLAIAPAIVGMVLVRNVSSNNFLEILIVGTVGTLLYILCVLPGNNALLKPIIKIRNRKSNPADTVTV